MNNSDQKVNVQSPFTALYQIDSSLPLDDVSQEIYGYAVELESYVKGDFHLPTIVDDIRKNQLSYVKIGLLAYKIKYLKLYQPIYSRFKDFCEDVLSVSVWQINRLIEAARVCLQLIGAGFKKLPTCEAQCRPLVKLEQDELTELWKDITENIPSHRITAASISKWINPEGENIAPIRLHDPNFYNYLRAEALEANLSVEEYLKVKTGFDSTSEDEPQMDSTEIVANWPINAGDSLISKPKSTIQDVYHWYEDLQRIVSEEYSLSRLLLSCLTLLRFAPSGG